MWITTPVLLPAVFCLFLSSLLCIIIFGPLGGIGHDLLDDGLVVPRDQLDLEVTGDGHQGALELVVVDVICVGGFIVTGNDLVTGQQSDQGGVE